MRRSWGSPIGIALLIVLNALLSAYRHEAARTPLEEIGADVTVQRSGNVPERAYRRRFPLFSRDHP